MVTRFNRRGHYRTNASGTRSYVRPHEVEKEYFSIKDASGQLLINGKARLRETRCRYCYNKVYHAALSSTKHVYFNNDTEPLIKHVCLKPQERKIERDGSLRKPKKFLSDAEIAAQEARLKNENENADKKSNKLSEQQLLSIHNKLAENTRRLRGLRSQIENVRSSRKNKKTKKVDLLELQRKLIAQEMITLNLQKSLFTDSKKLALIELKIIEKEKALEELSESQEKALEELSEAQRKRSNPINLDALASINTSVTLPSIGGEQKIQNPTKSRDHRPSPEGEEKIAIKERIQELQTQIELEDDENAKHVLTIEKLRAEQSLSSSWSDFMLIRDKIIRMKKEWEKKIEELKKEKQKSPEQIKKEISAQIALYKAAIAALESKAIRPNLKNKSKLRADIDKKKLAIERLSERRAALNAKL